jgi:hypothetical protein
MIELSVVKSPPMSHSSCGVTYTDRQIAQQEDSFSSLGGVSRYLRQFLTLYLDFLLLFRLHSLPCFLAATFMSPQDHERLMCEARAASTAARAALWRALVITSQIEKIVAPTQPNAGHGNAGASSA